MTFNLVHIRKKSSLFAVSFYFIHWAIEIEMHFCCIFSYIYPKIALLLENGDKIICNERVNDWLQNGTLIKELV
jgi:hypothetical protein